MKLIDPLTSRLLVQAVNVLGHHGGELPLCFPPGQNLVGDVWFKAQGQHFLPVKAVEVFRVSQEKAVADDGLRGIVELLAVQPVHTSKIRDAGFRAHPRAAKENDVVAFLYPLLQGFYFFHAGNPL